MTAEEFAEAVNKLIAAARDGGLSDAKMIVVLENAVKLQSLPACDPQGAVADFVGQIQLGGRH